LGLLFHLVNLGQYRELLLNRKKKEFIEK
jgi:hypothetical protein